MKNNVNVQSIIPLKDANFTPTMGNYKTLQPFRYWCQKVLPLVYDDSLSYYELLCKVVDYLNKSMEDVETLHDDVTNIYNSYVLLQNYVNTYFSSLDVQQEINNKLDSMVDSGELSRIFINYINPYPSFVDDVNKMTDNSKIYVLATNAHIYYWDGNSFIDSGQIYSTTSSVETLYDTLIDVSNFNRLLPDLNVYNNTNYLLNFGENDELPKNIPSKNNSVSQFINRRVPYAGFDVGRQIFIDTIGRIYTRYGVNNTWYDWVTINLDNFNPMIVDTLTYNDFNDMIDYNIYNINIIGDSDFKNSPVETFSGKCYLIHTNNTYTGIKIDEQILFTKSAYYYRMKINGVWKDWVAHGKLIVSRQNLGDFKTIKRACEIGFSSKNIKIELTDTDYDIIEEFGDNYFKNLTNVGSGIIVGNNIEIEGNGCVIICNYTGDNPNVSYYFSLFHVDYNNPGFKISHCKLVGSNIRYLIHDDPGGVQHSYVTEIKNVTFYLDNRNNTNFKDAIGGGLGALGTILISDCIVTAPDGVDDCNISYHTSAVFENQSNVTITNCIVKNGTIACRWYGTYTAKAIFNVGNNVVAKEIIYEPALNDASYYNNITLIMHSNEIQKI